MISSYLLTRGDVFTRYSLSTVVSSSPSSSSSSSSSRVYVYIDYSSSDPTPYGTLYCTPYNSYTRLLDRSSPRDSSFPLHLLREVRTGRAVKEGLLEGRREMEKEEGEERMIALIFDKREEEVLHSGNSLFLRADDEEIYYHWIQGIQEILSQPPKNTQKEGTTNAPASNDSTSSAPLSATPPASDASSSSPSSTSSSSNSSLALNISASSTSSPLPYTLPSLDERNQIILPDESNYLSTLSKGMRGQMFIGDEVNAQVKEVWIKAEKKREGNEDMGEEGWLMWEEYSDNHTSSSPLPLNDSSSSSSVPSLSGCLNLNSIHRIQMNKNVPELRSPAASFFAPNQCVSFISSLSSSSSSSSPSSASFSSLSCGEARVSVAFESLPARATFLLALEYHYQHHTQKKKREHGEKECFECSIQ